jgi:predicted metal-dependent enzyme (double-stranded beta helix superfamily)
MMNPQNMVQSVNPRSMMYPRVMSSNRDPSQFSSKRPSPATEQRAVAEFASQINSLDDLRHASVRTRLHVLNAVRAFAPYLNLTKCIAPVNRYGRRVLHDDPSGWTLAAISLRYGQETEAHDHDGWGGAVVVNGVERDRRYQMNAAGELTLISTTDYPSGAGYVFDASDIHQPMGADPRGLTVALHFLVPDHGTGQHKHEHQSPTD